MTLPAPRQLSSIEPLPLPLPTISDVITSLLLPPSLPSSSQPDTSVSTEPTVLPGFVPAPSPSPNVPSATGAADDPNYPQFKLVYLVPVFAVVGVIAVVSLLWTVHGCFLRRKRKRPPPDPEFIAGAPYEPDYSYLEKERRAYYAGRTPRKGSLAYRRSASASAMAINTQNSHSPPMLRSTFSSDSYESLDLDSDGEVETAPWDTRHKNIKRGQERSWMDSLRAVAGSVFLNAQAPRDVVTNVNGTQRPRGVSLYDDGPVRHPGGGYNRVSKRYTQDWIEQGRKRRSKSGVSLVSKSKNAASERRNLAAAVSDALRRPPRTTDTPLIEQDLSTWSPHTGFHFSHASPILHAAFQSPKTPRVGYGYSNDDFPYQSSPAPHPPKLRPGPSARVSVLPLSPPQIMSPPLAGELTFSPHLGTAPSLQGLATLVVQSEQTSRRGALEEHHERSRSPHLQGQGYTAVDLDDDDDGPLPNPRSRQVSETTNVATPARPTATSTPPRSRRPRKLVKKSKKSNAPMAGFDYERLWEHRGM